MARRISRGYIQADFYCVKCGQKGIGLMRKNSKQRESGHHKKLYCPWCQKDYNHVEIKTPMDLEKFQEDFKNGAFEKEISEIEKGLVRI